MKQAAPYVHAKGTKAGVEGTSMGRVREVADNSHFLELYTIAVQT